jgi:ubiquinone/menaquinone biosynthesis C-methylase UbiE
MKKYMEGLLVSQALWSNHFQAYAYFHRHFLPRLKDNFRYLEVGPGHGLYLSSASEQTSCATAAAWDVSEESLRQTRRALDAIGAGNAVRLTRQDVHAPTISPGADWSFDAIAICEVLEHLERPQEALVSLRRYLSPDGLLYINVPINSPAPDHIYLLRSPDEVRELVTGAGLDIVDMQLAPMTGFSVADAMAHTATINCLLLAR